jgi:hypothetical protein
MRMPPGTSTTARRRGGASARDEDGATSLAAFRIANRAGAVSSIAARAETLLMEFFEAFLAP